MGKSLSSDSRKSDFGEAARRSLETCNAGRAHPYRRRRSDSVLSFQLCILTIQLYAGQWGQPLTYDLTIVYG